MGLISAALGAAAGVLSDTWRDYFYSEAIPEQVLLTKARKRAGGGSENIISNGSILAVADGQCAIIVEQGKIAELCAQPGEYVYDNATEPSLFYGDLSTNIKQTFLNFGKRFSFGGAAATDQRVYFVNTRELMGNKYGTPSPVPFRVVDANIGLDMDISIRCFGEYSYRITDPILFYTNVAGNVSGDFTRDKIDGQLKTELLTALQPAFARISAMGVRYSALPGHTAEMADALNEELSAKWKNRRGIEIVGIGVSSVKASEEDEATIKELQRNAAFRDPRMAAAHLTSAQADAMKAAASNTATGPAFAFMNMNAAANAGGMNANNLYQMASQQSYNPNPAGVGAPYAESMRQNTAPMSWKCPQCGAQATGKFCPECGTKKPEPQAAGSWICSRCGATGTGEFCPECGAPKPAGALQYRCDKCGWVPPDPTKPPKFCPECGDPFDAADLA